MDTEGEVGRVAHELLTRIMSGGYPPGLRLPAENDLADTLACGRSTVREALSQLASLGVVRSRRGSGALVLDFRREGMPGLLPWYVLAGRFDQGADVLAREFLALRTLLAAQVVRLAARYAGPATLAEARAILARAPSLAKDPAAHARNELDLFRALVTGSGIWPAVWLANVFWAPMGELQDKLAGAVGKVPAGYQAHMSTLLDLIEKRSVARAEAHVTKWFAHVDEGLVLELEGVLGLAAGATGNARVVSEPPPSRRTPSTTTKKKPAAKASPEPVAKKRKAVKR